MDIEEFDREIEREREFIGIIMLHPIQHELLLLHCSNITATSQYCCNIAAM